MTGELDVALITAVPPTPRLNFLEIAATPFYVVVREHEEIANKHEIRLRDCHQRAWFLFGRHLNPALYETFMARAEEEGIAPSDVHPVTTAEEAAHLIAHHDGIAFLTQSGAWRIARNGLAMRPLLDDELSLRTVLVTRAEDRTRLVSEFVRALVRKLQSDLGLKQKQLALVG
jgi:LysR substrate binding domain